MLLEPRFLSEGWGYYDKKEKKFKLKPDAPKWAKEDFEDFCEKVLPNSNGLRDVYY